MRAVRVRVPSGRAVPPPAPGSSVQSPRVVERRDLHVGDNWQVDGVVVKEVDTTVGAKVAAPVFTSCVSDGVPALEWAGRSAVGWLLRRSGLPPLRSGDHRAKWPLRAAFRPLRKSRRTSSASLSSQGVLASARQTTSLNFFVNMTLNAINATFEKAPESATLGVRCQTNSHNGDAGSNAGLAQDVLILASCPWKELERRSATRPWDARSPKMARRFLP